MVWTVVADEDISDSSSLSSSSKDLLEEVVDMIDCPCVCEADDEFEVSRGLVGRIGSLMGGANVLIKDDETSERRVDILLEPLEKASPFCISSHFWFSLLASISESAAVHDVSGLEC